MADPSQVPVKTQQYPTEEEINRYKRLKFLSVILIGIAFFLYLISFGANYWAGTIEALATRRDHIGLWRYCTHVKAPKGGSKEICNDFINIIYGDWLKCSQSFMTLVLFSSIATVGCFFLYLFVSNFQDNVKVLASCFVTAYASVGFIAISLASFGGRYTDWFYLLDPAFHEGVTQLEWAFYLAAGSAFLFGISPILLLPDMIHARRIAAMSNQKPEYEARQPFRIQIKY